jgi:hypothetical protein
MSALVFGIVQSIRLYASISSNASTIIDWDKAGDNSSGLIDTLVCSLSMLYYTRLISFVKDYINIDVYRWFRWIEYGPGVFAAADLAVFGSSFLVLPFLASP